MLALMPVHMHPYSGTRYWAVHEARGVYPYDGSDKASLSGSTPLET